MRDQEKNLLNEIHEMLQTIIDEQKQLRKCIEELRVEQEKTRDELKLSSFVLNSIALRSEINN